MKKLFIGAILCLASFTLFAQEGTKNFIDQPYVEVTGNDRTEVTPNEIYIGFTIKEADSKGKVSAAETEKKMVDALNAIGINTKEDLKVSDMASNLRKYALKSNDIFLEKNYELCVADAMTAAKVFNALEGVGIANASIVRVSHSDMDELRRESKIKAIKTARETADQLARALGQKITKAIYIQDFDRGNYPRSYAQDAMMFMSKANAEGAMPEIEFEKIKIESSVLVRFVLEYYKL